MKWITHQTGAVLAAMAMGLPLPGIIATCSGAIMPDVIDQRISGLSRSKRARQKLFNSIHRGSSHWFGWWLGLFLAPLFWPMPLLPRDMLAGFALGALTHIGMDMLTPKGVPPGPFASMGRIALPICSTGKISEWIFFGAMLLVGCLFLHGQIAPALASLQKYF